MRDISRRQRGSSDPSNRHPKRRHSLPCSSFRGRFLFAFVAIGIGSGSGCSDDEPTGGLVDPPVVTHPELEATSSVDLEVNDYKVSVYDNGYLRAGRSADGVVQAITSLGPWVATEIGGQSYSNICYDGVASTFQSFAADSAKYGAIHVTPEHLANPDLEWPEDEGAPVDSRGAPRIYGDEMVWSELVPAQDPNAEGSLSDFPIPGLRMSQFVFGFTDELPRTIWILWNVRNEGTANLTDIHFGLWADTDLFWRDGGGYATNSTGYDAGRGITYTWDQSVSKKAPHFVPGYGFLTAPAPESPNNWIHTHRIMWRDNRVDEDWGELTFDRPEQAIWALEGKSNSNLPMVDPTTEAETLFAFPGNPVTGKGWLDVPNDCRSILGVTPFDLAAGESAQIIAVLAIGEGASLAGAIGDLQENQINEARRRAGKLLPAGR